MKKYLFLFFFFISSIFAREQQSFWDTYTSALRGDAEAQFLVGVLYENGSGVEQNDTKAAEWFEKSAKQGHMDAQYNIGLMYASGRGVKEDMSVAAQWLQLASDQGDQEAEKVLLKLTSLQSVSAKTIAEDMNVQGTIMTIPATVLYTKENILICDDQNICLSHKEKMVLTSIAKRGEYYKINGTLSKKGWKRYPRSGWIHEESIDHKK